MRSHRNWILVVVLLTVLVGSTTGCTPLLLVSNLASAAGGWVLNAATASSAGQYTCYRNGTPIDCSEVPAGLLPTGQ